MDLPREEVLKLVKTPADLATFVDGAVADQVEVRFKYQVEKFFFKFKWTLTKMGDAEFKQALIFPAFDALIKLQKNINRFNILERQDPEDLDRLPTYFPFDIKYLLVNLDALDVMSDICKSAVTIHAPPTPRKLRLIASPKSLKSPRKNGRKRMSAQERLIRESERKEKLNRKQTYESSDSSQEDPAPMEESFLMLPPKISSLNTSLNRRKKLKL